MSKTAWILLALASAVIAVAAVVLIVMPAPGAEGDPAFESANVRVASPRPNTSVERTFTVRGEARGTWFFEASFPIDVRDPDGRVIGQGYVTAEGEWMTEDFVGFTGEITVEEGYAGPALLVLHKHNASGLPEFTDSVQFPIVIKQ
jgi:hypothetical protein